jgi:hypothetical protein
MPAHCENEEFNAEAAEVTQKPQKKQKARKVFSAVSGFLLRLLR